jgi:hypothetical protein
MLLEITGNQLAAHLVGDYILQSNWMSANKKKESSTCFIHSIMYSIPFCFIPHMTVLGWFIIVVSHFIIDYYPITSELIKFKNKLCPPDYRDDPDNLHWTGYSNDMPVWLSTTLYIVTDNTLHILCNGVAFSYLS